MEIFVNTFFEVRVEQLFNLAALAERLLSHAGVEYRIVGGLAVYLYVEQVEPDAGRLTRDVAIAVRRADLEKIAAAAPSFGLQYRHVRGVDILVQAAQPSARRAIHMVFAGERVRQDDPEPVPEMGSSARLRELRLIPLRDLVRMKLTSFRLKDQVHLQDLDEAGLITADVEAALSPVLAERLVQVRAQR